MHTGAEGSLSLPVPCCCCPQLIASVCAPPPPPPTLSRPAAPAWRCSKKQTPTRKGPRSPAPALAACPRWALPRTTPRVRGRVRGHTAARQAAQGRLGAAGGRCSGAATRRHRTSPPVRASPRATWRPARVPCQPRPLLLLLPPAAPAGEDLVQRLMAPQQQDEDDPMGDASLATDYLG